MSSMSDWAEKEIELACKRENPNWDGESFDYGIAIYQSALKAYKSLLGDGHSGFSWGLAVNILNRLCKSQPLSPITEEDFEDVEDSRPKEALERDGLKSFKQCPRMSSLFRKETLDGKVTYDDVDRVYCVSKDVPDLTFSNGHSREIVNELFPIELPYYPPAERYEFVVEEFKYDIDDKYNDWDTEAYLTLKCPDGKVIDYNKYYKFIQIGTEKHLSQIENVYGENYIVKHPIYKRVEITPNEYELRLKDYKYKMGKNEPNEQIL